MTRQQVLGLNPGDKVQWNDPDDGACSRVLTIKSIKVTAEAAEIEDMDFSVVCALFDELEPAGKN